MCKWWWERGYTHKSLLGRGRIIQRVRGGRKSERMGANADRGEAVWWCGCSSLYSQKVLEDRGGLRSLSGHEPPAEGEKIRNLENKHICWGSTHPSLLSLHWTACLPTSPAWARKPPAAPYREEADRGYGPQKGKIIHRSLCELLQVYTTKGWKYPSSRALLYFYTSHTEWRAFSVLDCTHSKK